jgi:hypothetical protein
MISIPAQCSWGSWASHFLKAFIKVAQGPKLTVNRSEVGYHLIQFPPLKHWILKCACWHLETAKSLQFNSMDSLNLTCLTPCTTFLLAKDLALQIEVVGIAGLTNLLENIVLIHYFCRRGCLLSRNSVEANGSFTGEGTEMFPDHS